MYSPVDSIDILDKFVTRYTWKKKTNTNEICLLNPSFLGFPSKSVPLTQHNKHLNSN